MNKAYLLVICLLLTTFTGCLDSEEKAEENLLDEVNCEIISGEYEVQNIVDGVIVGYIKFSDLEYDDIDERCNGSYNFVDTELGYIHANSDGTVYDYKVAVSFSSSDIIITDGAGSTIIIDDSEDPAIGTLQDSGNITWAFGSKFVPCSGCFDEAKKSLSEYLFVGDDNAPGEGEGCIDYEDENGNGLYDSGEPCNDGSTNGGGKPEDTYACNINSEGFCIFTGTPHKQGLEPGTDNIVDREGNYLFGLDESVAANSEGMQLQARGTPAFDGDQLIQSSQEGMSEDEKAFHKVIAIMFPIRNALMYDIGSLTQDEWNALVNELEIREIKETTFTDGQTPKDNYYGRQGIFDLAKDPNDRDIHHDVMKFLEESGLYLLCHVTSDDFAQMLADTHPEGHNPCEDAGITTRIPFTSGDNWGQLTTTLPEIYATSDVPQSQIDLVMDGYTTASEAWGNFGPLEFWIVGSEKEAAYDLDKQYCEVRVEKDSSLGSDDEGHCLNRSHNLTSYVDDGGAGLNTRRSNYEDYSVFIVTFASKYPSPDETGYTVVSYHEYFHVYQQAHIFTKDGDDRDELMGGNPYWAEGGAEYMAQLLYSRQEGVDSNYLKDRMSWKMETKEDLEDGESIADISYGSRGHIAYDLGCWFTAYIINQTSEEAYLNGFYDDLNELGWEGSFVENFGVSSEQMLSDFDDFLDLSIEEQLEILP